MFKTPSGQTLCVNKAKALTKAGKYCGKHRVVLEIKRVYFKSHQAGETKNLLLILLFS